MEIPKTRFQLKFDSYFDYFYIDQTISESTFSPIFSFRLKVGPYSKNNPSLDFSIPTEAIEDYNNQDYTFGGIKRIEEMFRQLDTIVRDKKLGDLLC